MAQATEKQMAFITKLLNDKKVDESSYISWLKDLLVNQPEKITKTIASEVINTLKALPYKTSLSTSMKTGPAAAGYYILDGKIYKVQVSPNSGHAYAKVFSSDTGWTYITGMVYKLNNASPLTLEQAKEYGKLYGQCIVCARTLTDEESIAAGIGPICAGKF